jgi:predicted AlkP superfamily pyrophosphatase or phosphodiesterase
MVGNVWFDRESNRLTYNIEDADYHLLSADADVDRNTEIDPTQKAAKVDGRSPSTIMSSTFSDELAVHFNGKPKIFGVSVKDRGAVSLAGHAGKAFWFSKASGAFVTSSYYYDKYPGWVMKWNARKPALLYAGKSWELMHDRSSYLYGDSDDQHYETDFPGFGRTFPHPYGTAEDKYFTTRLTLSPAGDELTLDFAKSLIKNEQLGQDEVPDYLAVSFSSTDYVGHLFGASSLETEDNLARLDRTLADLFKYIDENVGLDNTLIVLSADHGQPEIPGHLHLLGIHDAAYFDTKSLDKTPAIEALKKQFGLAEELIETYNHPYIYLNRDLIHDKQLNQAEVEQAIAEELVKFNGVSMAVSSTALRTASLPDTELMRSILNNFHPNRSGDIILVFEPNVFINDFDGLTVASTHGSPWRYDTFVPVIFAGAKLKSMEVSRPITPYDVAPTLANYLGIKPPSGSTGNPLKEVLTHK